MTGQPPSTAFGTSPIKRLLDGLMASLLLVCLLPLLPVVASVIVLESGRPVFFKQMRIGWQGKPFKVIKFRTLYPVAHHPERPLEQTTRVGRLLRRWGLDEVPQLWNIVLGQMSLVGPRPALPEQVAAYDAFERRRLEVRPGITGWAQVHGRNSLSWPERIRYDVWYVDHASFWIDLRILFQTPLQLFSGQGVYGAGGINPTFDASSDKPLPSSSQPDRERA